MAQQLTEKMVEVAFTQAGFEIYKIYEAMNNYWPRVSAYHELIVNTPWFLVLTDYGVIRIGNRKRVIEVDWDVTPNPLSKLSALPLFEESDEAKLIYQPVVTVFRKAKVTHGPNLFHAWTYGQLCEFLTHVREEFERTANDLPRLKEVSDQP